MIMSFWVEFMLLGAADVMETTVEKGRKKSVLVRLLNSAEGVPSRVQTFLIFSKYLFQNQSHYLLFLLMLEIYLSGRYSSLCFTLL